MITSVEEMISKYVNSWNEQSLEAYKTAFGECWTEDATYTDPDYQLSGVDAIAGLALKSLEMVPSRTFEVLTQPEYHHRVGRYTWQANLPDGPKEGFDFFEFNDEFKLTRIVTFLNT